MSRRIVMSENYFKKVNAHSLNKEARDMTNSTDKGRKRSSGKKRNQRHKDMKLEAVCVVDHWKFLFLLRNAKGVPKGNILLYEL